MIRPNVKHIALSATLALCLAAPATAETLSERLSTYVTAFDVTLLTATGRQRLLTLLDRNDLSHADRVLGVHAILKAEEALRHPDIHGAALADLARAG